MGLVTDKKTEIEKFLKEFAKVSGTSVVEGLVKKAADDAGMKIELEDSKIKNNLSTEEGIKLYGHIIVVFSKVYGTNLVEGVMKKVEE